MQPLSHPFSATAEGKPIVLATHEYEPFRGGVATYVREIAEAAERIGCGVEVWTVDYRDRPFQRGPGREPHDTKESSGRFPVVRLPCNGRLTPGGLLRLAWGFWRRREQLRGTRVVLLSVGVQMAFFLLAAVGAPLGGHVTCFFHGSEVLRFRRNRWWCLLARRYYQRHAAGFTVTTRYVEGLLRDSGLLPAGAAVAVAPCGLPSVFHVEQSVERRRRGSAGDPWRVLTAARLHPRKGQLEVAGALGLLPEVQRRGIVYQLVGVGSAAYRRSIEEACRATGVRCELLGAVDDEKLRALYAHADVYAQASRVLPRSVEGFGLSFLEAAAQGCPAAAWRSGGVAEAVIDGQTGLLVEEGDTAGLAAAIGRLLADHELRFQLGENGKKRARAFRWEGSARVLCGTRADRFSH